MMEKLLDHSSPVYGRRTGKLYGMRSRKYKEVVEDVRKLL